MIDRLIQLFLRTPLLAVILAGCLCVFGWRAYEENPKDAIPDIAENQTIVFSEWMGRSPKDVDEQVTYPLTVALQGVPDVKEIRATSGFGWSIVYVVFKESAEFYWARSRVLERLNVAQNQLPPGVTPRLGPDATALGQVYWYTVENGWYSPQRPGLRFDENGVLTASSRQTLLKTNTELATQVDNATPFTDPIDGGPLVFSRLPLDRLRSIQDFDVKLALESVEGVSEVASIGGFVRQYQIDVNPDALRAFRAPLSRLVAAVNNANIDVGAKVIEENGMEILIRGVGFLGGEQRSAGDRDTREQAVKRDIENIVIHADNGTPVYLHQVASVSVGPDFRRGALDKMGAEAVGGCVTMRFAENPLTVINRVSDKVNGIEHGLPPGVRINAFYDRTDLINETMGTLTNALSQELLITMVAVILFLLHFRSSLVIAITLPLAVLFAFICMQALNLSSNIMSLAGIAIAIGTMVDMGIVMLENIYQYLTDHRDMYVRTELDESGHPRETVDRNKRRQLISEAATEVGSAILTAVSTTVVSFLPVFFLEGQAAKLFTPLAWTKTFCMVGAVLLALTVVPPLASLLLKHRRASRPIALTIALIIGTGLSLAWWNAASIDLAVANVTEAIQRYLGWSTSVSTITVGAAFALLTYVVLRERIRPIESNPTSRFIHKLYEPTIRWVLHHKILFLSIPCALIVWGIGIWIGWGPVVTALIWPAELLGMSPAAWSAQTWLIILVATIVGVVIAPLILDTLRVARHIRRRQEPPERVGFDWLKPIAGMLAFAFVTIVTHHAQPITGRGTLLAAMFGSTNGQSLTEYQPIQALLDSKGIGQEFMPPLDEGDFLYMPSVLPAGSINTVMDVMQKQDAQFAEIPEVDVVVGKLGRVESPLDPAPVGMLETMILLKPREHWPTIDDPDYEGLRRKRTMDEIWSDIKTAGSFPGVLPSVELQPIRTRVEMLSTGLNAKIGLKIYGDSVERCEALAVRIEQLLRQRLEHAQAINAVRISGKPYLEFQIDREAIARYGVNVADVQQVIEVAIGGKNLTTTYEGLDRYPVRIRYERELRDEVSDLERILVPTPSGAQIPITLVANIQRVTGPMSVRREGAKFVGYVTMSNQGIDETTLVKNGQRIIDDAIVNGELQLPEGYDLRWAGSYERNIRAKKRLSILIPLVMLCNFLLIYLQFKRWPLTLVIFLAIPVAFAGGFIMLEYWPHLQNWFYTLGLMDRPFPGDAMYLTVAVWVGFIALFGIAVDDGIVIGTYLDQVFSKSPIKRYEEIEDRVVHAGLRRIRPTLMTTFTTLAALAPVLLTTGRGSDVMTPMALPVFGGMVVAMITILIVPTCYCAIKQAKWKLGIADSDFEVKESRSLM
ncbi:MAG TPA: efflux RND transporter permease subunit [Phycisphaerae bacterium]|nr:efflux RND transporter permease subunit [Phycisphaerae bacterium]